VNRRLHHLRRAADHAISAALHVLLATGPDLKAIFLNTDSSHL
jgi:hypothetical protein